MPILENEPHAGKMLETGNKENKEPKANINCKILKTLLLKLGTRQGCQLLPLLELVLKF